MCSVVSITSRLCEHTATYDNGKELALRLIALSRVSKRHIKGDSETALTYLEVVLKCCGKKNSVKVFSPLLSLNA